MEKYTLGERTEDNLLSILTLIIDAGHSKKQFKIMPLEQALLKTETVTILFRLTRELGIITEKQYADCAEDLQRIGQMLGGWRRSL